MRGVFSLAQLPAGVNVAVIFIIIRHTKLIPSGRFPSPDAVKKSNTNIKKAASLTSVVGRAKLEVKWA